MPQINMSETDLRLWFENIYRTEYTAMIRYATIILKAHGSKYVSADGRAEEAVQEMFAFAWENRKKLLESDSPTGWLYKVLYYKVRELLNEDKKWAKRLLKMSEFSHEKEDSEKFHLRVEMEGIISDEDYRLLSRLYLDGYTYAELCSEMGIKKSALAMRVMRIKERFLKEYETDEF